MISRSLLAFLGLLLSSAAAAAPNWTILAGDIANSTYLDKASVAKHGDFMRADVLRNYDEVITLGNDPVTGADMYPHRSVKVTYHVDCGSGMVAMTSWKMFEGSLGNGEVVWADKLWGKPNLTSANDAETRDVLRSTCATKSVSR
ncbi:MAG: hypothetical protein JSW48_15265 [Betaproteobacteria bacterium]|nr:MAG: hypothetical protein JSW48_15265 [Betaproteobacteria bacterium]